MNKVIYLDLDGTLLNSNLTIDKATIDALAKWHNAKNKLVIATGRPLSFASKINEVYNLNSDYIIALNGGIVVDCDNNLIECHELDYKTVQEVADFCEKRKLVYRAMSSNKIFHNWNNLSEPIINKVFYDYLVNQNNLTNYQKYYKTEFSLNDKVIKLSIYCLINDEVYMTYYNELFKLWPNYKINLTKFNETIHYMEISPKGISKAKAIKLINQLININDLNNVLTVGDSGNDIEMLSEFPRSYCPNNATDEAKKAAKIISLKTNNESFIVDIINKNI